MAEPQMVDPHDVVMTGENSFIRLSNDGGKTLTDRVSHWRVLWSPAGQGHALFIESGLLGRGPTLYADNAGVARYLQRTIEPLLYKEFGDESLPVVEGPDEAVRAHHAAGAKPFPQERFGKPASSCCLAWSESWTRPRS